MPNIRSITPNDHAGFTPELGNYKTLQPFRYWCQKVLPLVYDDSLSYYELLCKVVDYLNKTMEDVETLHGDVTNIHEAYEKLQSYVNNYFSTLDVQEEINNKLDEMANNGELADIISDSIFNGFNLTQKIKIKSVTIPSYFNSELSYEEKILDYYLSYGCNTVTLAVQIIIDDASGANLTIDSGVERMIELLDYAVNKGCENIILRFMSNYTASLAPTNQVDFANQYNDIVNNVLKQIEPYRDRIYCIGVWNELYTMRTANYSTCANLIIDNIHKNNYRAMCSVNKEQMLRNDVYTPYLFDIIGFNFYPWCGNDFTTQTWNEQIMDLYAGKEPTGDGYSFMFYNIIEALIQCFKRNNEVMISEIGCSYYKGGTNPTWKSDFTTENEIDYNEQSDYYNLVFNYLIPNTKNLTGVLIWTGTGIYSIYNNPTAASYMREGFNRV